jgi:hypothetical protein
MHGEFISFHTLYHFLIPTETGTAHNIERTVAQLEHDILNQGTPVGIASVVKDVVPQFHAKVPARLGQTLGIYTDQVAMSDAGRTRVTARYIYAVSRSFSPITLVRRGASTTHAHNTRAKEF